MRTLAGNLPLKARNHSRYRHRLFRRQPHPLLWTISEGTGSIIFLSLSLSPSCDFETPSFGSRKNSRVDMESNFYALTTRSEAWRAGLFKSIMELNQKHPTVAEISIDKIPPI